MATDILPNCGPTALSFITGQPVNELMEAYRNHFGYTKRWKGGTYWSQLLSWLDLKNKNYNKIPVGGSLKTWVNKHTTPNGIYMVRVGNHFLTVKNQLLFDQYEKGKSPTTFWARNKRVTHAVKIGEGKENYTIKKTPVKYSIDDDPSFDAIYKSLWD